MKKLVLKSVLSICAALVATAVLVLMTGNPGKFGQYPLFIRACVLNLAIVVCLSALYPYFSSLLQTKLKFLAFIILPSVIPAFIFYLLIVPSRAVDELCLNQKDSDLLSDRSSNGIIEIGFQYPIFTPSISLINHDAFTREVNVFLRMIDKDQESALFRAVR